MYYVVQVSEQLGALGELSAERTRPQADSSSKLEAANSRVLKTKGKNNGKAMVIANKITGCNGVQIAL